MSMPGKFPALNLNFETYIQNLQQFKFKDNPPLTVKHTIGQTISGTVLDRNGELTETFYGIINNNYNDIIVNGILTKNDQISNVSGIVSTFVDKTYLLKLQNLDDNTTISSVINDKFTSYVSSEFLTKNDSTLSGLIENVPTNIWRINSDSNILNIGYEALNVDVLDETIKNNIEKKLKEQYNDKKYIGLLRFKCELFERYVFKNPEIKNTALGKITYEFDTVTIKSNNINNLGLLQLHKKYPNCYINNNVLYVEVIITTLGRI